MMDQKKKEVTMAKFYALGNYTAQGFSGFCKDPKSDRSKAAQVAADAVGAKLVSYTGLRGAYDFFVVFEGSFEQAAAIKVATEASGSLCNITICEEININNVAEHAAKIAKAYKGPGQ
tara:strand:- start:178 stop:531 length:354 start_codon:yes stop_codon:yes gene_type:complete